MCIAGPSPVARRWAATVATHTPPLLVRAIYVQVPSSKSPAKAQDAAALLAKGAEAARKTAAAAGDAALGDFLSRHLRDPVFALLQV